MEAEAEAEAEAVEVAWKTTAPTPLAQNVRLGGSQVTNLLVNQSSVWKTNDQ